MLSTLFPLPPSQEKTLQDLTKDVDPEILAQIKERQERRVDGTSVSPLVSSQWMWWTINAVIVGIGITSGLLGLIGIRRWQLLAAFAALLFLAFYVRDSLNTSDLVIPSLLYWTSENTFINVLQTKVRMVAMAAPGPGGIWAAGVFAYVQLVMPVVQFAILLLVVMSAWKGDPDRREPTE